MFSQRVLVVNFLGILCWVDLVVVIYILPLPLPKKHLVMGKIKDPRKRRKEEEGRGKGHYAVKSATFVLHPRAGQANYAQYVSL